MNEREGIPSPDRVRDGLSVQVRDRRPPPLVIPVSMGVAGVVRGWELIDAETGIVKRSCYTPYQNVITDAGLDAVMGGAKDDSGRSIRGLAMGTMRVGTDNTAPAQSDTSLGNEVAATASTFSNSSGNDGSSPPQYWFRRQVWEFGKNEANNTLAELGTGETANLWMRQLFRDDAGNATTISKTSEEILRIQYEVRLYPDLSVKNKTLNVDTRGTVNGVSVDYQPQKVDDANIWGNLVSANDGLGFWDSGGDDVRLFGDNTPPGNFTDTGPSSFNPNETADVGFSLDSYTAGSFARTKTWGDIGASVGNFTNGIGCITYSLGASGIASYRAHAAFFATKIDKTSNDELRDVAAKFSLSRVVI